MSSSPEWATWLIQAYAIQQQRLCKYKKAIINFEISRTTNCRLYSYILQILLLYKTWGYYNIYDSAKSLGYITDISKYNTMEHGLAYISYYV